MLTITSTKEYDELLREADKMLVMTYRVTEMSEFKKLQEFLLSQQEKIQHKITLVQFVADINTLNSDV